MTDSEGGDPGSGTLRDHRAPSGGSRTADVPHEVPVRELIPELDHLARLPDDRARRPTDELPPRQQGPRPRAARGRDAGVGRCPEGDRLMMTADVTAGALDRL